MRLLLLASLSRAVFASSFTATASCGGDTYFDSAQYGCRACVATSARASDNSSSGAYGAPGRCACLPGYYLASPRSCDFSSPQGCGAVVDACAPCPSGLAPSADGLSCAPCGGGAALSAASGACACPAGAFTVAPTGLFLTVNGTGAWVCAACPPRTRAFPQALGAFPGDPGACGACRDPRASATAAGACACDAGFTAHQPLSDDGRGVVCVPAAGAAQMSKYATGGAAGYSLTGVALPSALAYQRYFLPSAVGCWAWAPGDGAAGAACQALANLCALALGAPAHPACAVGAALAAARAPTFSLTQTWGAGWATGLPLLTWGLSAAAVATDTSLPAAMALYGPNAALRFHLARWALNGTFLGLSPLTTQLNYCVSAGGGGGAPAPAPAPAWFAFGAGGAAAQECDLVALLTAGAASFSAASTAELGVAFATAEPTLYDLFVEDLAAVGAGAAAAAASGDRARTAALKRGTVAPSRLPLSLVPIPVRITNYVDAKGARPNANGAFSQESDDVFVGRFALWDAASGATEANKAPLIVRYVTAARLTVTTLKGDDGNGAQTISIPVLTLTYAERSTDSVLGGAGTDTLTVTVEYTRATYTSYASTLTGCALALGALVLASAATKHMAWHRMNSRTPLESAIDLRLAARAMLQLASAFAPPFYWLLVVFTLYWLVFFKLQVRCAPPPLLLSLPTPPFSPPPPR